ncbi:MAG TPA: hypothetical protein VI461_05035 [Chitinophagaceae bacterium]|nr:hypothetical protein [Chitinophagaceae bacterium]
MKGIAKLILPVLLPVFLGASVVENTSPVVTPNQIFATLIVTEGDVRTYLENLGYVVVTADPIGSTCNWTCETYNEGLHLRTTVFTDCNSIIGHEDDDF